MSASNPLLGESSNILADPALSDHKLAAWLTQQSLAGWCITLIYAKHLCAFATNNPADSKLVFGDVGDESLPVIKQCAKNRLLFGSGVDYDTLLTAAFATSDWLTQGVRMTATSVQNWHKVRQALFTQGRGKSLSSRDESRVWHEAAGRCMYRGCGEDLTNTSLTTKSAAAAYLAHIVASDEDGPRGDPYWSHTLSDDPNNVMLMCDAHHRLVDRIDVVAHPSEHLNAMRAEHVAKVRAVLDSLRFPNARGIALLGDIGNIKTPFHLRDMRDAMLAQRLSPNPEIDQLVRNFSRDDRLSSDYWRWVLKEYEDDFRSLMRRLGATHPLGDQVETLCVFPLHYVPILILCGRLIGEARRIEVFQYSRGKSWQWPTDTAPQKEQFFYIDDTKGSSTTRSTDAVVSLELTADIDFNAFPEPIKRNIEAGTLPWLRIRAESPNPACITHPEDLAQFTKLARRVVTQVQDVLRAERVHLFGVSPASTLFRFGQILQPGNHADYIIYDRPDRAQPFNPAISISGRAVQDGIPAASATGFSINLR
ncbi:SAVED domain-containing protein [Herminiimonas arsenitoxidans]|uniref:SAVED domain-containing protein n=1 Tax=Herminiimonas arsenitoxidans TaxID=1809410 RepID=UPI0012FF958B|nr:SAVED domain-containing protein [Herminiimonas arsenitoxidans]